MRCVFPDEVAHREATAAYKQNLPSVPLSGSLTHERPSQHSESKKSHPTENGVQPPELVELVVVLGVQAVAVASGVQPLGSGVALAACIAQLA